MDNLTVEAIQAIQKSVESINVALKAQGEVNEAIKDELISSHKRVEFLSEKLLQTHIELRATREVAACAIKMLTETEDEFTSVINVAMKRIQEDDDSIILRAVEMGNVEDAVDEILAKMKESK